MSGRQLTAALLSGMLVLSGCSSDVSPSSFFGDGPAAAAQAAHPSAAVAGIATSPATASVTLPGGGLASPGANQPGGPGTTGSAPHPGNTGVASPVGAISSIAPGSCAGFHNTTGIDDQTIAVGNVADLSGPVTGLFSSAQQAAQAYQAYFNSTSSICGRKLKVISYDSQTSAIGDQDADQEACDHTFAMVGSISAFDDGGVQTVEHCGIPDIRAISTTPSRVDSAVSFDTDSVDPRIVSRVQYQLIKSMSGNAYQHSALLYLNAGAAVPNALAYRKTMESLGYHFDYQQAIDITSFNYIPYAARMKSDGVTLVQFEGSYQYALRLKQAMATQGVNPVFVMDSAGYDPVFIASGGDELNGIYSYVDTALFEEASRSSELQTYVSWLKRTNPSAQPSFFGMFAWGAMELFTELAIQLGGQLTRSSLLGAVRATHGFTANGLFAPMDVGGKVSPKCQTVIQLEHSVWQRRSPFPYSCADDWNTTLGRAQ